MRGCIGKIYFGHLFPFIVQLNDVTTEGIMKHITLHVGIIIMQ